MIGQGVKKQGKASLDIQYTWGILSFLGNQRSKTLSTDHPQRQNIEQCALTYRLLLNNIFFIQWILYILQDLKIQHPQAVNLFIDRKFAYCIAHNLALHERSKHIQIDVHFTREKSQQGIIKLVQLPTTENLAGALTKPL